MAVSAYRAGVPTPKNYVKGFVFGADADRGCKVSPGRLGLVWSSPGRGSTHAVEGGSRVSADLVV